MPDAVSHCRRPCAFQKPAKFLHSTDRATVTQVTFCLSHVYRKVILSLFIKIILCGGSLRRALAGRCQRVQQT
jgi:hypothetical protein